jgi:hypothetical protein
MLVSVDWSSLRSSPMSGPVANDYRMMSNLAYQMRIIVVAWVGTYDEYSKINWKVRLARNEVKPLKAGLERVFHRSDEVCFHACDVVERHRVETLSSCPSKATVDGEMILKPRRSVFRM